MGLFAFLLEPQNIPFLLALASTLVLALLQIFSGGGDGDADADADIDADMDVNADIDADVDVDADIDAEADADTDAASISGGGFFGSLLAALGVGRVPLLIILMVFMGSFGASGLLVNTLLADNLNGYPELAIFPVFVISFLFAFFITNRIGGVFARIVTRGTAAISAEQLVGRVGKVVSHTVSTTYGRVEVRDKHGSLHTVYAIIREGEPLPDQSEVALVAYDAAQRHFIVSAMERRNV